MTNQQILTKAIEKAIDGWWKPFSFEIESIEYREGSLERNMVINIHASDGDIRIMYNLEAIIFNHDFAKALWGENPKTWVHSEYSKISDSHYINWWQYHLQQMVIADDPIAYLGEHLDG